MKYWFLSLFAVITLALVPTAADAHWTHHRHSHVVYRTNVSSLHCRNHRHVYVMFPRVHNSAILRIR